MAIEVREAVVRVLASFVQAKQEIERTFAVASAADIVSAVLRGRNAREGRTLSGLEYFVHGIGYTVVVQSGGQAHFDSGDTGQGDVFSAHDVLLFMETSGHMQLPAVSAVKSVLNDLSSEGALMRFGNRYGVQNPSLLVPTGG
ncbi:hypothetical protein [Solwaraspora sp. WMMD792]|uniref:DUF6896 domain-containing protein n=1 Tax=Solwaraspora sp. WMMD792 TaxID=3016099 RepID=UPI002416588F|nr:hypothetical protein [Solwaraspora sp. WMMD792]MDG4770308.1 hypothetical protein [Solwaraspora sp. WMMD792]